MKTLILAIGLLFMPGIIFAQTEPYLPGMSWDEMMRYPQRFQEQRRQEQRDLERQWERAERERLLREQNEILRQQNEILRQQQQQQKYYGS
jgi:hypothetical protein